MPHPTLGRWSSSRRFGIAWLVLLGAAALYAQAPAPPVEIPVPPVVGAPALLHTLADFPPRPALPPVLVRDDGTTITAATDWPARRAELRRILERYAVGHAPPAPGNVRSATLQPETRLTNGVRYRLLRLSFGPDHALSLTFGLFLPPGDGPFPLVISPAGTPPGSTPLPRQPLGPGQGKGINALLAVGPGPVPNRPVARPPDSAESLATQHQALFARGYGLVVFDHNECAEDTTLRNADGSWAFRNTRFFPAYPGYDWGILGAWAWGVSRVVDHLQNEPGVDTTQLILTGVSRTGKSAMIAAAFDERIAMVAPVVTGGGGIGVYRFSGDGRGGSEGLDLMMTKYPNWFSPQLHAFRGHTDQLPFDNHWFLALCAPRPFLALEGETDPVSVPNAVKNALLGAQPAYTLLGASTRLGVNYAPHGHALTADDWTALMDFADWHLRGRDPGRRFDRFYEPATATVP